MKYSKKISKKIVGVVLILIGLFALLTPLTPGSWLIFVGLEMLGIRLVFLESYRKWRKKRSEHKPK